MIRLLAGMLLWAVSFGPACAVDYIPPESLAAVPVPAGAAHDDAREDYHAGSSKNISSDISVYRVPMTAEAADGFYKNAFALALINYDGDMPVYEEMEDGAVSGIIYSPVYYDGSKIVKSAVFSWGDKFKGGWRVFEVRVSEDAPGSGALIKISETIRFAQDKVPGADEGISGVYRAKLKEFKKMAGSKVFLGVPKYPNSVFLPQRSAAMTAENMGRDTFVFASMDDPVIAADFYAGLPDFQQLEAEDEIFIFKFTGKKGVDVSVAVTGRPAEGEPDLITEITVIDMAFR